LENPKKTTKMFLMNSERTLTELSISWMMLRKVNTTKSSPPKLLNLMLKELLKSYKLEL